MSAKCLLGVVLGLLIAVNIASAGVVPTKLYSDGITSEDTNEIVFDKTDEITKSVYVHYEKTPEFTLESTAENFSGNTNSVKITMAASGTKLKKNLLKPKVVSLKSSENSSGATKKAFQVTVKEISEKVKRAVSGVKKSSKNKSIKYAELSGETSELSGETSELSGETSELSGETSENKTAEFSGETSEVSGETSEVSGETSENN